MLARELGKQVVKKGSETIKNAVKGEVTDTSEKLTGKKLPGNDPKKNPKNKKKKETEKLKKRRVKNKKTEKKRDDKRREKQEIRRNKKKQQRRERKNKRNGEDTDEKDYGNSIGKIKNNMAREKYGKRFSQLPREQKKELEKEAREHLSAKKTGKFIDKAGDQLGKYVGNTFQGRLLIQGLKLQGKIGKGKDKSGEKAVLLTPTRKLWLYFLGVMSTMGVFFASAIVVVFLAMAAIAIIIIEDKDLLKSSGGGGGGKTASKTTEEGSGNISVGAGGQIDGIDYETFTADGTYKGKVSADTPVSQLPITTENGIVILKPDGLLLGGGKTGTGRTSGYTSFFNGIPLGSENSISGLGSTDLYVKGSLASPLPKLQLTSNQMPHRDLGSSKRPHMGIDFSCTKVSDIDMRAMADGVVRATRMQEGYGNRMDIVYNKQGYNGLMSRYAHLAKFYKKPGDKVKQGDKVALCGGTGGAKYSYTPHAHVELYKPPYLSADLLDAHYYMQLPINRRAGHSNMPLN